MELSENEIDVLLKTEKYCFESQKFSFPQLGGKISIPLFSENKQEEFLLDISRSRIEVLKTTYQNRARKTIILLRLDIGSAPHRNPNGQEISSPHLHIYKECYGDKFAYPLPEEFNLCSDSIDYLNTFMDYCNIVVKPNIDIGLFV